MLRYSVHSLAELIKLCKNVIIKVEGKKMLSAIKEIGEIVLKREGKGNDYLLKDPIYAIIETCQ